MADVIIRLNDQKERVLRYSLLSSKRLKEKYGVSIFDAANLLKQDEEKFAEFIFEGLRDRKGNPPEDIPTVDAIFELIDTTEVDALLMSFIEAWKGGNTAAMIKNALDAAREKAMAAFQPPTNPPILQ